MNTNRNTTRIAIAVLAAGIGLGASACGTAAGEESDAPKAPDGAIEQLAGITQAEIGPRPSKDARLRCYPRLLADPDQSIPDRCFWE